MDNFRDKKSGGKTSHRLEKPIDLLHEHIYGFISWERAWIPRVNIQYRKRPCHPLLLHLGGCPGVGDHNFGSGFWVAVPLALEFHHCLFASRCLADGNSYAVMKHVLVVLVHLLLADERYCSAVAEKIVRH